MPAGTAWHPATDRMSGTDAYGDKADDKAPWSVPFHDKVWEAGANAVGKGEFLFATGDCKIWLVMAADQLVGNINTDDWINPGYGPVQIKASSKNPSAYSALMYLRKGRCAFCFLCLQFTKQQMV